MVIIPLVLWITLYVIFCSRTHGRIPELPSCPIRNVVVEIVNRRIYVNDWFPNIDINAFSLIIGVKVDRCRVGYVVNSLICEFDASIKVYYSVVKLYVYFD